MPWIDLWHSNTVKGALLTVLIAAAAYLSGQVDGRGAALLVLTGLYQVIQRSVKINREGKDHEKDIDS